MLKKFIHRCSAAAFVFALAAGLGLAPRAAKAQSDPFIGQLMIVGFNFCPRGWATADGQLLAISSNTALFALLGTTYGGDGRTTFALPDLRGRVAMHAGNGPGLSSRTLGQKAGTETNTLSVSQMPSHTHQLVGTTSNCNANNPAGAILAVDGADFIYNNTDAADNNMSTDAVGNTGGGQSVNNMQPFLVLNYCVALVGVFPSRN